MIILNQDKDEIINFDNTASIYLVDEWDDKPGIVIKADNIHGSVSTLGYYKNSDRAKEILEDISLYKAIFDFYKYTPEEHEDIGKDFLKDDVVFNVYEMPKE